MQTIGRQFSDISSHMQVLADRFSNKEQTEPAIYSRGSSHSWGGPNLQVYQLQIKSTQTTEFAQADSEHEPS